MLKKIMIIGLFLAACSWTGNILYYNSQKLDKPIMLEHYYEFAKEYDTNFRLHYITDLRETNDIVMVDFPELEQRGIFIHFDQFFEQGNKYRHHQIKTLNLNTWDNPFKGIDGDIVINEMRAHLRNGETIIYPIGEIVWRDSSEVPFESTSGESSSDGTGYASFSVKEGSFEITDVNIRGGDRLGNFLIKINNQPYEVRGRSNLQEQKGNTKHFTSNHLYVDYSLTFEESDPNRWNFYNLMPTIVGTKENGNAFELDIYVSQYAYFSEDDLKNYLSAKKKGKR
ncbi:hypothetical protein [Sutcliffiella rhizosphaerae]|uniref:Lipoprotein n=1 Tax=Sutcliffiella rhizosphaerae TaxID=2880967 RepID=A0ABM8YNC7_9BACI|nr:hypothetical protein [Sutcliffiella rhizosphaerae]CAG9621488.1 hypothetical protein BACCIP111883_02261 [Sutcliffiella rhizosphaerae]